MCGIVKWVYKSGERQEVVMSWHMANKLFAALLDDIECKCITIRYSKQQT